MSFDRQVGPKQLTNLQSFSTYSFGIVLLMMIKGEEEQRERRRRIFEICEEHFETSFLFFVRAFSREREKQMLIELCGVPRRKKNYKNVNHVDSDGRLSNSTPGGFPLLFSSPFCPAPSTFSGYLIADCGEAADAIARSQLSSHSSDSRRRRRKTVEKGRKVVRSREIAERNKK